MIVKLAWKNVWRNRRRSLIVIAAVLLSTILGVFAIGLVYGLLAQRIYSCIYVHTGSVQIHSSAYLRNPEVKHTIIDYPAIAHYLENNPAVEGLSPRLKVSAMAATSRSNIGVTLLGVYPQQDQEVSDLSHYVLPHLGSFLPKDKRFSVFLPSRMADALALKRYSLNLDYVDGLQEEVEDLGKVWPRTKERSKTALKEHSSSLNEVLPPTSRNESEQVLLYSRVPHKIWLKLLDLNGERYRTQKKFERALQNHLTPSEFRDWGHKLVEASESYKLNQKIVFTFTQTDGTLISQYFRVRGIFDSHNALFDRQYALVNYDDLLPLLGLKDGACHEVILRLEKGVDTQTFAREMQDALPLDRISPWQVVDPMSYLIDNFMGFYSVIIMGFILFALLFGVINTMLMAILERTREIAMLLSIGMSRFKVRWLIVLETIFLVTVGAVIGLALAAILIQIAGHYGIYLFELSEGLEEFGYDSMVYPFLPTIEYFKITGLVFVVSILASLYPAYKAIPHTVKIN